MENASKALLIAGAILIAILLIGIGMMVFNSISGITTQAGQQIDAMEIQMFNSKFEQYAGNRISGSNVKALLTRIKANNATYADDLSRVIIVDFYYDMNAVGVAKQIVIEDGKVKDGISISHAKANEVYDVTCSKNNSGFIYKITISHNPPS